MVHEPRKYEKDAIKECSYCFETIHYSDDFCPSCKIFNTIGTTVKSHNKELAIKTLLEDNFDPDTFIHDRIVPGGCSKKRPDFLLLTKWGNIIVEVDEFQHKRNTYPCECEITRMKQIYFDCGVEHLLFIRYNPDNYKVLEGGKPITPIQRKKLLIKIIKEQFDQKDVENLGVMYLFYDGYISGSSEIEDIKVY